MNWEQIIELHKSENVEIGNHSHSHEYLVEENPSTIKSDILKSIQIFEDKLGRNSEFFSYPLVNIVSNLKILLKNLGFKYAFWTTLRSYVMRQKIYGSYQDFQSMKNMVS